MKTLKKRISILLTIVLLTFLLSACKASPANEALKENKSLSGKNEDASKDISNDTKKTDETSKDTSNETSKDTTNGSSKDIAEDKANVQEAKDNENKNLIKVLYSSGLCGIPLHIAKQLEFFEAEGLVEGEDYEYVTSSLSGVEMLTTGQADVSFGLVAAMLAPLDNGLEAKTVLGIHTGCILLLAGTDTGISSVSELKGKKIGVQQLASSAHIVAQRVLASEGIGSTVENMEVEFVTYGKDDLPIALKEGAVDAIAIGDPQATILINEGDGVELFNSATDDLLKDEYCCSLWVRNEALEKYPDEVTKVVTAIQKASAWVDQNTDLAAKIQLDNEWLVGDLEIDRQVLKTYKYLPSVSGVETALTRNILEMKELGLIRKDTNAEDLAKSSFLRLEGLVDEIVGTVESPIDPNTQIKNDK